MNGGELVVGLIGYGAVGRAVAEMLARGDAPGVSVAAALVRERVKYESASGLRVLDDPAEFLSMATDLVVEAAGQRAVRDLGVRVLAADKDLMIVSTGALVDHELLEQLRETGARSGRRILIPSGSVGALDAIASASLAEITDVAHTIRKPPRAFTSEQLGGRSGLQTVYDGNVREGASLFPENANAATAVALAAIGPDRTRLRIIADPSLTRNAQEIDVTGAFGHLRFQIENVPSSNPKTSRLVALSVVKALRNMTSAFVLGV